MFFDVGDTLVEHWAPRQQLIALARAAVLGRFGDRPWFDAFWDADIEPPESAEPLRQETNRWYREWFLAKGIELDGIDLDSLRSAMCVPLDLVSSLVSGAPETLRWCKRRGLRVVLVTNTLSRGDEEVREDWRRFGLADAIDGVVSSHSIGWRKPHAAMFERALELAAARPDEAAMVGDQLHADVWGAKRLGLRGIWRRTVGGPPEPPLAVTPDAVVDDLRPLPGVLESWL